MFRAALLSLSLTASAYAAEDWPDIDEPLKTGAQATADAAVVIGVEDYPFLTDVPYASRDAAAFYDFLVYTRGVPSDRVQALYGASAKAIREAVSEAAAEVESGGVLWVYYAGHGGGDPDSGERLLVGDTAKPAEAEFAAGAIAVSEVRRLATAGRSEVMLVVDACYNGLGRDSKQYGDTRFAVPSYDLESTARITEWTAAAPTELASPLHEVQHGAFTYFVLGALRGWADGELDGERDGAVTPEEARLYVERSLRTVGHRNQHPEMVISQGLIALSQGDQPAPDLRGLTHSGAAAGVVGISLGDDTDLAGLAAEAQAAAERAAALEEQLHAERESRFDAAVAVVQVQASEDWGGIQKIVEAGLPEARGMVEKFLQKYGAAAVTLDDEVRPIAVAELEEARVALAKLPEEPTEEPETASLGELLQPTVLQSNEPPELAHQVREGRSRTLYWIADGVLIAGGAALLGAGGLLERSIRLNLESGVEHAANDETLQLQVNALYLSGYSSLGVGLALGTGLMISQPTADGAALGLRWSGHW